MSHVNTGLWFCLFGFFVVFDIFEWLMLYPIATYTSFTHPCTYIMLKFFPSSKMRIIGAFVTSLETLWEMGRYEGPSYEPTLDFINTAATWGPWGLVIAGVNSFAVFCLCELFRNHFWLRVFGCNRSLGTLAGELQFMTCPLRVLGVCTSVSRGLWLVFRVMQYRSYFHIVLN